MRRDAFVKCVQSVEKVIELARVCPDTSEEVDEAKRILFDIHSIMRDHKEFVEEWRVLLMETHEESARW